MPDCTSIRTMSSLLASDDRLESSHALERMTTGARQFTRTPSVSREHKNTMAPRSVVRCADLSMPLAMSLAPHLVIQFLDIGMLF